MDVVFKSEAGRACNYSGNDRDSLQIPEESHLFRSSAWREAWLEHWQPVAQIGKSGLYNSSFNVKRLLSVSNLVPVGQHSQSIRSVRSEYFQCPDVLALQDMVQQAKHQVTFADVIDNSPTARALFQQAQTQGLLCISRNPTTAYSVDCRQSLSDYKSTLSSSARLQMFGRRKRLNAIGRLELSDMSETPELFLKLLNQFHEQRWGQPCFCETNQRFLLTLFQKLVSSCGSVHLSVMRLDDKVISVLLDLRVGDRRYNLQSGYSEALAKGISLGILHLGYAIEASIEDEQVAVYDFLAGGGKHTDYKARFATDQIELTDLVIVRARWLRWLYRFNLWMHQIRGHKT